MHRMCHQVDMASDATLGGQHQNWNNLPGSRNPQRSFLPSAGPPPTRTPAEESHPRTAARTTPSLPRAERGNKQTQIGLRLHFSVSHFSGMRVGCELSGSRSSRLLSSLIICSGLVPATATDARTDGSEAATARCITVHSRRPLKFRGSGRISGATHARRRRDAFVGPGLFCHIN